MDSRGLFIISLKILYLYLVKLMSHLAERLTVTTALHEFSFILCFIQVILPPFVYVGSIGPTACPSLSSISLCISMFVFFSSSVQISEFLKSLGC